MNLTLRRAAKLRSKIEARLSELYAKATICTLNVNVNDTDVLDSVHAAETKAASALADYEVLNTVLTNLRSSVGSQNAKERVATKLTEIAGLEKLRSVYLRYLNQEARPKDENILARVNGQREIKEGRGYNPNVSFTVLSDQFLTSARNREKELAAAVEAAHDALERINATTEITLTDVDTVTLQSVGLL